MYTFCVNEALVSSATREAFFSVEDAKSWILKPRIVAGAGLGGGGVTTGGK